MKLRYLSGLMLLAAGATFTACSDDDDYSISNTPIVTDVETGDAIVTAVSASIGNGIVKDLSGANSGSYEVGVVYSTAADPTKGGTRAVGSWSNDTVRASINGLSTGTKYYYATYVCLQGKVYKYGEVKEFTATNATAAADAATDVTYTHATINASFAGIDGLGTVEKGIKVGRSNDAATLMETPDVKAGEVKGLLPGTTYYYLPYVKVGDGYVLGNVQEFTTQTQDMEYVDLGLSVMWAKYNIGAEQEQETGTLLGYGDGRNEKFSKLLGDYIAADIADNEFDITNELSLDGASPMLSAMPSLDQVKELIQNTTKTIEEVEGVKGIRFTAANGNSIFLPYTGYRDGTNFVDDGKGFYWTGNVSSVNTDYASTLTFDQNGVVKNGNSLRYYGVPVRTVRPYAELKDLDNGKLVVGDLEGNGRIRIEIYNEYGNSKNDPIIDPSSIKFAENMVVTFRLSGLNDNYKEDAAKSNIAGLEYADAGWGAGHWNDLSGDQYTANVTGDGIYTVYTETGGANGAVVFCIDIKDLANDLVDPSKVQAELLSIKLDADVEQVVNQDIVQFQNKDGNGTDGRIEIYNEYGNGGSVANGFYNSSLNFVGNMAVTFTISGIDGNLVDGASKNYRTELSYAAASWYPSYWGGSAYGRAQVTGDGTYTVYTSLPDYCSGAVVWTIELYDLWKDLVDTDKVKVTIDKVVTPCKN